MNTESCSISGLSEGAIHYNCCDNWKSMPAPIKIGTVNLETKEFIVAQDN
jgi:hypothetical protein